MATAGQQLFDDIAAGLWSVLESYRSQAAAVLAPLTAEPGVAGTPLDGLLQKLKPNDVVPAADAFNVKNLIQGLLDVLPADGGALSLHGFDPRNGQPRGLALVVNVPDPASTFIAALTADGPTGIAIEFAAAGAQALGPATLQLADGWSLTISGNANGGGRLLFPRGGSVPLPDAQAPLTVSLTVRYSGAPIELGPSTGPHVSLTGFAIGASTTIDKNGNPKVSWTISLPRAQLSLVPDAVKAIVGDTLSLPVDLDLTADPETGLSLKGGGVRASIPANFSLPGIEVSNVDLALTSTAANVAFGFGLDLTGSLPGVPLLSISASGIGAAFPLLTGAKGLGLDLGGIQTLSPTGLGLDLPLPVISGGGFLERTPDGYGGVLELNLLAVAITAFGLLQLPAKGKPSFVAIISVEFPFPGIDLSFGFALAGVGGIVGINRRLDRDALNAAVVDGSAAGLLFPVDPAAHAPAIIATLGRVFPSSPDHILVGPMLKVTWGGRIVSIIVAVVVDLPNPVQFVVIGRVTVSLPDPLLPLVFIQATFAGSFELSPQPSVSLVASLDGSYIEGMPLHGDIFFLVRGGDEADFVFSAGGFNPRFQPPKGVPPNLERMQLAMTPPGVPGLRAEAYFAVTTNTVQFGARLELCYEIAGCGVDGWFGFDALFKWDPVFSFAIHANAGVAVQVIGETLMGINFDLNLEGPAPWHVHGSGSVDLFLFSASLDFDATWGSAPPALPPPEDLYQVLAAELAQASAWIGTPPAGEPSFVSLSAEARDALNNGPLVHPLGSVTVRQRAMPLGIAISRFQQQPIPEQTWTLREVVAPTRDQFPPGELLNLTDDEKLSQPAFIWWPSGGALAAASTGVPDDLPSWDTGYETSLVQDPTPIPGQALFATFAAGDELWLAAGNVHHNANLWNLGAHPIVVLPSQPVTVATKTTMSAVLGSFGDDTSAAQAAKGLAHPDDFQVVESWEVVKP
jgi:hypothetical protein